MQMSGVGTWTATSTVTIVVPLSQPRGARWRARLALAGYVLEAVAILAAVGYVAAVGPETSVLVACVLLLLVAAVPVVPNAAFAWHASRRDDPAIEIRDIDVTLYDNSLFKRPQEIPRAAVEQVRVPKRTRDGWRRAIISPYWQAPNIEICFRTPIVLDQARGGLRISRHPPLTPERDIPLHSLGLHVDDPERVLATLQTWRDATAPPDEPAYDVRADDDLNTAALDRARRRQRTIFALYCASTGATVGAVVLVLLL